MRPTEVPTPIAAHRDDLHRLCVRHRVKRLDVFGSATGERFDPARSDFDFLVVFLQPMTPAEHVDRYFVVRQFVSGKSFAQYLGGPDSIGEAVGQIAKLDAAVAARITAAKRIVAFRNLLIHNYWDVADDLVWGIVEKHVPVLEAEVNQLLREVGGPANPP